MHAPRRTVRLVVFEQPLMRRSLHPEEVKRQAYPGLTGHARTGHSNTATATRECGDQRGVGFVQIERAAVCIQRERHPARGRTERARGGGPAEESAMPGEKIRIPPVGR